MSTQLKAAVSNLMRFEVKATLHDENGEKDFKYYLIAKRSSKTEITNATENNGETSAFLMSKIAGWKDQKLILTENDEPAEFSEQALDLMLDISGMELVILSAYMKANAARVKN